MSDLYPRLPRVPEYPPPTDSDPYRWCPEMDLPLIIRGTVITTRPDSGCDDNIMRVSVASYLDLPISRRKEHRKSFRVANGKSVEAVGRVSIWSCFPDEPWKEMRLNFYLLPKVVTPLIMGMSFLADKKILSENRHLLRPRKVKRRGPYQVSLLNNPKRRLRCIAQSEPASGNPDTGSEIDLMSLSYVTKRGFELEKIENEDAEVVFADGSSATLAGKVTISLIVCSNSPLEGKMSFYVLEDLTCDILFGEEFLHSNEIFQKHQTAFSTIEADGFSEANAVFKKNKFEKLLSRFFRGGKKGTFSEENNKDIIRGTLDDARELDVREENRRRINNLEGREREVASELETKRMAKYDRNRGRLLSDPYESSDNDSALDALEALESMDTEMATPPTSVDQETSEITGIISAPVENNTSETPGKLPPIQSFEVPPSITLPSISESIGLVPSPGSVEPPGSPKFADANHADTESPKAVFRRELPSPGRGLAPFYYNSNSHQRPTQTEGLQYTSATDWSNSTPGTVSTVGSTPLTEIDRMKIDGVTNPQIGGFQCTYPGCTAQPFQTQYILNSHANVHSANRPHFCSVKGCPRSEGGKGFKRKNEMIRHGLVHDSPGYVCPFCSDREHKYPRPDFLQR
jgi:hypothetical protein